MKSESVGRDITNEWNPSKSASLLASIVKENIVFSKATKLMIKSEGLNVTSLASVYHFCNCKRVSSLVAYLLMNHQRNQH